MGVWRNGSASDFDCHSLSEGCSFEYCHAHFFPFCDLVLSIRDASPPPSVSSMLGQQQQQQPAGGLFGSTTQGPTSTGTGLFGSTTTQQQPSGGLFGATQNPSTSTGTSLFGSTQQQPSAGLFVSTTPGTQGTGTGGGLFGSTNPQQQQQPQQGSLFGNATTTPAQPSAGGNLFGSTTTGATQPSTGGLFGTGTLAQGSGGNIFGTPSTTSSTTGGGLFGAGGGTTTGGNLFGSTTQSTQNTGGGLFGTQPTSTIQPTGSLFSSTIGQQPLNNSTFGTSTATQPQPGQSGLFGQSTGGFGGTGGGLLGNTLLASTLGPSLASSQLNSDPGVQYTALTHRIEGIKNAWDASSQQCKFQVGCLFPRGSNDRLSNSAVLIKHYFYNLVEPNQVRLYGRPTNATNEILWQKAVRENPDSTWLVVL